MIEPTVLVVLGKNWRRSPFGLSLSSKMNALAAGHLFVSGKVETLIFSGGKTAGPDWPSEAEAMALFMRRFYSAERIPDNAIILEEESIDTAENAEHVSTLLDQIDAVGIVLLTTALHLPAARQLFAHYQVDLRDAWASEQVLYERSPHYHRFLRRYNSSPSRWLERVMEMGRRALLYIDRAGRVIRLFTEALRR